MWKELRTQSASWFCNRRDRAFKVSFRGEAGLDYGGLYRDAWSQFSKDLVGPEQDLFVRTYNNQARSGNHRDCWLPSESAVGSRQESMFTFLGKFFALSCTGGQRLSHLRLAPLFWKQMTLEEITEADLEDVNVRVVRLLRKIRSSRDADEFAAACEEEEGEALTWTLRLSADVVVPLRDNGASILVPLRRS